LEVGAEEEFKLDLGQDHDPEKQKLKDAIRTKTHPQKRRKENCAIVEKMQTNQMAFSFT
jgi:hypothetical protein